MKLSNFAWFIDLFMTLFNQKYPLRYYISTFDGYCLIIQIINQIPFIYFAVYARFSVNMVNPYGGQYIVLFSIGMHLFNHCVKALLLANIVYLYILMFCNGGGFLSVKDAFSETGYPAFYR